jgi:hypothetical protein
VPCRVKKKRDALCSAIFWQEYGQGEKLYVSYVEDGIDQERRPEFTGSGLIRSLGGWEAVKKLRRAGHDRIRQAFTV